MIDALIRYALYLVITSLTVALAVKTVGNSSLAATQDVPEAYLLALSAPRHLAPNERYVIFGGLTDTAHIRVQWQVCAAQGHCTTTWSSPWHPERSEQRWYHLGHLLIPEPGRYVVRMYLLVPYRATINRSVGYASWEVEVERP